MWLRKRRQVVMGNRKCGCRQRVRDCEVWTKVFDRVARELDLPSDETVFDAIERAHRMPPRLDTHTATTPRAVKSSAGSSRACIQP